MKKTIIALILIFSLVFSLPANAYQINDYEMHHNAGMLISLDTGNVLYSKNADDRIYPASITLLMTALVLTDNISDLESTLIPYTSSANNQILGTGSVVLNLKVGEEITAKDALAALLIPACGDVAYAVAEYVGGDTDGFVDKMNAKAEALGMTKTHFTNPIGLHDDDHYSTADDIYKLASAAFENTTIKDMLSKTRYTVSATNMTDERTIITSNQLININSSAYYRYAVCGKTGFTDKAGRCLVSTASYNGYNYMAIVLGARTVGGVRYEFVDTANMYRWAFNNFQYKTVLDPSTPVTEAPVKLSADTDHIALCFEGGLKALLPKEANASTIDYKINLKSESFNAPIKKGEVLGTADIYYAEEKIGTLGLVASQDVKSSAILVLGNAAKEFFTSTFMIVIYIIVAVAAVIFGVHTLKLNSGKKKRREIKYIPLSKDDFDE